MVNKNFGITFLYIAAVEKELAENQLGRINLAGFSEKYEFNFVFLKDSIYKKDYLEWYNLMKSFGGKIK